MGSIGLGREVEMHRLRGRRMGVHRIRREEGGDAQVRRTKVFNCPPN